MSSWHPSYIAGIPGAYRPWMVIQNNPLRHMVERKRKNMRRFETYRRALLAANKQNRLEGLPEVQ